MESDDGRYLATAVGDDFKILGMGYEAVNKFGVSTKGVNDHTKEALRQLFTALRKATGFEDNIAVFVSTPTCIIFPAPSAESSRGPGKQFRAGVEVCAGTAEVPATYST